ncbi:MAG: hypothetical protein K6G33_01955 [Ruminococcus sp.]|uniref:hypothetical protein n=1 Tax=Ruminococcus sp. TaxID=41978 RepID=UPI0025FA4FB5|nr:hypothetical protein [Ruminococcus sp.]MCR5599498.1 hypothetical protein [Ruminococcus sp.]
MNEYERKEFKVRQIMSTFLSAQYVLVIWIFLQFMPQSDEIRYELTPLSKCLPILGVCTAVLVLLLLCSFYRIVFITAEWINVFLCLVFGVLLTLVGVLLFVLFTWHFWVYLMVTKDALNKYRINHISDYEKAEAKYRNEHQGLYPDDNEE